MSRLVVSRAAAALTAATFALALAVLATPSASAQTTPQAPAAITGRVTMLSTGVSLDPAALKVDAIVLTDGGVTGTVEGDVAPDGSYRLEVEPDALGSTYVPRATYDGVQYFGDEGPVRFDESVSSATRDFEVYATTTEQPDLEIVETVMTVVAIDRGRGELGLIREDLVRNPSDRVYVGGGEGRITLRLPAPDATEDAAGENADGRFTFEGGVVTTTTPIRAATETSIVTRYLVTYDVVEDGYALRVTAPMATGRSVLRIPESYVRGIEPQGSGVEGEPQRVEVADSDPVRFLIAEASNLGPGDGLVVNLQGFAPEVNRNVLTDSPQAAIGAAVALLVLGAAAAYVFLRRPTTRATDTTTEGA